MNDITQKLWTRQISNTTLLIDENYGLTAVSIILNSGTGTIVGGAILSNGVTSTPINLVIGQPITLLSDSNNPLAGITITTTGVVAIIGFN
jgi:hypothetical protein